jgi:hypothetical protein
MGWVRVKWGLRVLSVSNPYGIWERPLHNIYLPLRADEGVTLKNNPWVRLKQKRANFQMNAVKFQLIINALSKDLSQAPLVSEG